MVAGIYLLEDRTLFISDVDRLVKIKSSDIPCFFLSVDKSIILLELQVQFSHKFTICKSNISLFDVCALFLIHIFLEIRVKWYRSYTGRSNIFTFGFRLWSSHIRQDGRNVASNHVRKDYEKRFCRWPG